MERRYKCLLCGRDKFTQRNAHNCIGGFRKRGLKWEDITPVVPDVILPDASTVILQNNKTKQVHGNSKIEDWTKIQPDGTIHVPDELDAIFNKIGIQLRFHTISGKGEVETIAHIVYLAQQFFLNANNNVDLCLPDGNQKRQELQDGLKRVRLGKEYIKGHSQGFADCYNWIHSLINESNEKKNKPL